MPTCDTCGSPIPAPVTPAGAGEPPYCGDRCRALGRRLDAVRRLLTTPPETTREEEAPVPAHDDQ